ncbi:hypothetical protein L914_12207 [Phytophthora nicotianae]|uniref:Uncharacterized protein n=1 Tax=Phytophthora nicotianae TaxID=4792 RepID=W2N0L8_PHYNI|nr:hypothetical protein L914_12207 [Phytophthora nicotianae]
MRRSGLIALRGCRLSTLGSFLEIPIECRYPILQAIKLGGVCSDRGVGNPQTTLVVVTQDAEATSLMIDRGLETIYFCVSGLTETA